MDTLVFPSGEKVPPQPAQKPDIEMSGVKFRRSPTRPSAWEFWNDLDWIPTIHLKMMEDIDLDPILELLMTAKPVVQAAAQVNGMFRHNPKMRDLHAAVDQFIDVWKGWDHNWLLMEDDLRMEEGI